MSEIITFYGADGSGKSTIAHELSSNSLDTQSFVFGGSSYKEWLTPKLARSIFGRFNRLPELSSSPEDLVNLYEDIAVACYGLAFIIKQRGDEAIIDSDPYFKRMIWGSRGISQNEGDEYINKFESRMVEFLGDSMGPTVIVGINVGESTIDSRDVLERLTLRTSSSEHDPSSLDEVDELNVRVNNIWKQINLGTHGESRYAGMNSRLSSTNVITDANPTQRDRDVVPAVRVVADRIRSRLTSTENNNELL